MKTLNQITTALKTPNTHVVVNIRTKYNEYGVMLNNYNGTFQIEPEEYAPLKEHWGLSEIEFLKVLKRLLKKQA